VGKTCLHRERTGDGEIAYVEGPDRIAIINSLNPQLSPANKESAMAKFDGIIGQDVLTVTEGENELTIIFRDNRYLFIKVVDGKLVTDSVPE